MSQPPQTPPPPPPSGDPGGSEAWSTGQHTGASGEPVPPGQQAPPPRPGSNGLAIAALVCGIVALLLSWIPVINVLALLLGLVAVGCGIGGIRKAGSTGAGQKGVAVGGLVTGILAILLSLVILVGIATVFSDPDFREPFDRLREGDDPQDVLEDLEREMEQQG